VSFDYQETVSVCLDAVFNRIKTVSYLDFFDDPAQIDPGTASAPGSAVWSATA